MILPTQAVTKLDTGVDAEKLRRIGEQSVTVPPKFVRQKNINNIKFFFL